MADKPSEKFSFKGWNVKRFIQGRKKMIITLIAAIAGYVTTQNPALTAVVAAGTEMAYALIEYYVME